MYGKLLILVRKAMIKLQEALFRLRVQVLDNHVALQSAASNHVVIDLTGSHPRHPNFDPQLRYPANQPIQE
jgi:hypothetical protein